MISRELVASLILLIYCWVKHCNDMGVLLGDTCVTSSCISFCQLKGSTCEVTVSGGVLFGLVVLQEEVI